MTDRQKKPLVRLEDTKAATTDENGNSRVRMEALSRGGEIPTAEKAADSTDCP